MASLSAVSPPPIPPRKVSPASTPRPSPKHQPSNSNYQRTGSNQVVAGSHQANVCANVANNNHLSLSEHSSSGRQVTGRVPFPPLPKAVPTNEPLLENNNFWSSLADNGNHLLSWDSASTPLGCSILLLFEPVILSARLHGPTNCHRRVNVERTWPNNYAGQVIFFSFFFLKLVVLIVLVPPIKSAATFDLFNFDNVSIIWQSWLVIFDLLAHRFLRYIVSKYGCNMVSLQANWLLDAAYLSILSARYTERSAL